MKLQELTPGIEIFRGDFSQKQQVKTVFYTKLEQIIRSVVMGIIAKKFAINIATHIHF